MFTFGTARQPRGAALVIAMMVIAVLLLAGTTFLTISSTESQIAWNERAATQAFLVAEAAVARAAAQLSANPSYSGEAGVAVPGGTATSTGTAAAQQLCRHFPECRLVADDHHRPFCIRPATRGEDRRGSLTHGDGVTGLEFPLQCAGRFLGPERRRNEDPQVLRKPGLQPLGHRAGLFPAFLRKRTRHIRLAIRGIGVTPENQVHAGLMTCAGSRAAGRLPPIAVPRIRARQLSAHCARATCAAAPARIATR